MIVSRIFLVFDFFSLVEEKNIVEFVILKGRTNNKEMVGYSCFVRNRHLIARISCN